MHPVISLDEKVLILCHEWDPPHSWGVFRYHGLRRGFSTSSSVVTFFWNNLDLTGNVRSQFMAHHQFIARFCDCPIKCVKNYFLWFYSLLFDTFWITGLWPSSNDTILSLFCHNLAFCHHVVTILSQFTMRRRILYSDDKLKRAIGEYGHYCHWIDECLLEQCVIVISNDNRCMWVRCSCTLPIG